jgi:HTH-type transcriptional regulator/antitoxin HigA
MAATVVVEKLAGWSDQDRADYAAHCSKVPLLSIRNDEELDQALEKISELIDAPGLSAGSERYLEALSDLVGVYESKTVHFPKVGGVEVLRFLMEEHGLHQKDLVQVFGSKSIVSEVLNGKRRLSLRHIAKLSEYFGVPSDVFMETSTATGEPAVPSRQGVGAVSDAVQATFVCDSVAASPSTTGANLTEDGPGDADRTRGSNSVLVGHLEPYASQGLPIMAAVSSFALAGDMLRTIADSPAVRDLRAAAETIAKLDSSKAITELQGAVALLKGADFVTAMRGTQGSVGAFAALASEFAASADPLSRMIQSMGTAMAGLFASGAIAIAFRTTEGYVEVESSGQVVRIPADKGMGADEVIELSPSGGLTYQERPGTGQRRLLVGHLCIEVDAVEVRPMGT